MSILTFSHQQINGEKTIKRRH